MKVKKQRATEIIAEHRSRKGPVEIRIKVDAATKPLVMKHADELEYDITNNMIRLRGKNGRTGTLQRTIYKELKRKIPADQKVYHMNNDQSAFKSKDLILGMPVKA